MIDVLTLVKNREAHLRNLVEGLRRSAVAPSRLIVVDMGERPVAPPECAFPVTVIRHAAEGLPLGRARNLAAAAAEAEHLLFLDVDCIPASSLLGAMSGALLQHDALICPEALYLGPGVDLGPGWTEPALRAAGQSHPSRPFPRQGLRREPNAGLFWSLAFGVARATFQRIGGFDETFTGYGAEDTDFSFTARKAGVELLFLGGPGVFHQYHGVFDPPLNHFADIVRNARIFHGKWGVWPMEGWLAAFERSGLVAWSGSSLRSLRSPTENELSRAVRDPQVRF